jgi:HSP20 family protein
MWAEACALLDEAERKHRRFYDLLTAVSAAPAWEPPANVFARGGDIEIMVALPGARFEDLTAHITAAGVQIEAMVGPPAFAVGVEVVRLEIPYGRMRRTIELPPGNYALLELKLDRGYLFLRLARSRP